MLCGSFGQIRIVFSFRLWAPFTTRVALSESIKLGFSKYQWGASNAPPPLLRNTWELMYQQSLTFYQGEDGFTLSIDSSSPIAFLYRQCEFCIVAHLLSLASNTWGK